MLIIIYVLYKFYIRRICTKLFTNSALHSMSLSSMVAFCAFEASIHFSSEQVQNQLVTNNEVVLL